MWGMALVDTPAGQPKTATPTIRLTPDLWTRFDRAAKARLSTRNRVAEDLIQRYVDEFESAAIA